MSKKRKKNHGGLKFLAFMAVVAMFVVAVTMGVGSEVGQRVLGHREARRIERSALTPRFAYASAKLTITMDTMKHVDGTRADLTTTEDVSIDRRSATASREVRVDPTPTQGASGTDAAPVSSTVSSFTQILGRDYQYESTSADGPWQRWRATPAYYGTELDRYYIPMIDDIMGYELRSLPPKPVASEAAPELSTINRPAAPSPAVQVAVTKRYSYEMDVETFRSALPILASRADLQLPLDTIVTVTLGFDDVGLLRYADLATPIEAAATVAQKLDLNERVIYRYTLEVTEISGEPIDIELPTAVVDAAAGSTMTLP